MSHTPRLEGAHSRFIRTNGVQLHVVEAGPQDGPLVILLHGFPEFWYGWRKQIGPLAAFLDAGPAGRRPAAAADPGGRA